jgi:hypothetical protein
MRKICTVSDKRKQFNPKLVKNMAERIQIHLEFSTSRNSRSNTLAELAVEKVQKYLRLITPNFDNEQEVEYAIELSCHLINTEIKKYVELTPLEIVYTTDHKEMNRPLEYDNYVRIKLETHRPIKRTIPVIFTTHISGQ